MLKRLRTIGPGALAAAAFIGPGTVTTATIAGAQFGYSLLWTLVFATLAALILHEMSARLGVVSGKGLGEAILDATRNVPAARFLAIGLILSALAIGNAAYEGGNIAGAVLGVQAAAPDIPKPAIILIITAIAGAVLIFGGYRLIEKILIAIVCLMSICFATAFIVVRPDIGALIAGLKPTFPPGALMLVTGLIGTTIVPYNLFLHAAAAKNRWSPENKPRSTEDALTDARFDAVFSIGLGGLISILILSTAGASLFAEQIKVANAADMAHQLEPAFGVSARYLIGAGLFAAGLSSAITAPLATAYAVQELFQLKAGQRSLGFRATAGIILILGTATALSGAKPVAIILFAQFANGLLLPFIGVFLLFAANQQAYWGITEIHYPQISSAWRSSLSPF